MMAQYLPLLFLLACPLMMLFMMRGMSGTHSAPQRDAGRSVESGSSTNEATTERIGDLERQVAELQNQLAAHSRPANLP